MNSRSRCPCETPSVGGDVGDRPGGRVLEQRDGGGAAVQPAVGLVEPRQQHRPRCGPAASRVASSAEELRPQRPPRPASASEQVDDPAAQRRGVDAEHRPAADRRGHDADAVGLARSAR